MGEREAGRLMREVLALLLAASCAGCERPGVLLCDDCRSALQARPVMLTTPAGLPVQAALPFDGVAARLLRRVKEDGATSLARPLGRALRVPLAEVAQGRMLVPVPTSRAAFRRRGYRVPDLLLRRAGETPQHLLGVMRRTRDQRQLGREERAQNVAGSMRVRRGAGERRGNEVVIVDDVVTTGATFDEAARALRAAGLVPVCGVAVAATPSHRADRKHGLRG